MTRTDIRLPAGFAPRVRDILAGSEEPVAPRDASTVVLLRAGGSGFDVYLLRRTKSMEFAPGVHVFPGGSVDPRDADAELGWAGPGPATWSQMLLGEPDAAGQPDGRAALARALVCAAVRETFEESGVLLAGPATGAVVADTRGDDWEADRRALIDRSLSLAGLLQRRGLVLRSDLLSPWARWITPTMESRRFDTRFFAAALPGGQRTRHVGGEADEVVWLAPAAAIAAARRGEILLMPPTAVTLAELARYANVTGALAASTDMAPRQPGISLTGDTAWLTLPDGLEYPL
ncbi:MAG TPA: NUDIX hydrolase [Streptosporangiaceae bacterium]|nr:NUDIX hydrolase [Streptosporangiaceae bacterium]